MFPGDNMMRIEIEMVPIFDQKINRNGEVFIPFNSNKYLQGAIYDAFSKKFGRENVQKLHDTNTVKPFAFTYLLAKNRKVTKDGLFVRGPVRFMFSSVHDELAEAVLDYFSPGKEVTIIPNRYRVIRGRIFENPRIKEKMTFKTVTPFVVVDKRKNYRVEDIGFAEALWKNIETKTKLYGGNIEKIRFHELKSKKITFGDDVYFGYYATFSAVGDEEGLKTLYYLGIGVKNSSGFGFLKII
jgi:CRISPR-associated endoribonuclease Cas6